METAEMVVPCRFYNRGGCMRGDNCRFSHAPDNKSVRDSRYNSKCVYSHSTEYLEEDGWWSTAEGVRSYKESLAQSKLKAKNESGKARQLHSREFKEEPEETEDNTGSTHDEFEEEPEENTESTRDEFEEAEKEREENMGFTHDELNTLLSYGIKPWDNDAWDFLRAMHDRETKEEPEEREDDTESIHDKFEEELEEREENMGFTHDELNTLLSYGIKPWDNDAWDFLREVSTW